MRDKQRKTEEGELVAAAKSGDSAAFEALVMRHKRLVLAITRRMTRSFVEAEDVSQQAFMKAFTNAWSTVGLATFDVEVPTVWAHSFSRKERTASGRWASEVKGRAPCSVGARSQAATMRLE